MAETKTIILNVDTKGAVKSVDNLNKSTKETSQGLKETKKETSGLSDSLTGMGGAFAGPINGAKALLKSFIALLANPIGLIIAAISLAFVTLYKAFTSTRAGAEKLEQVMAGLGAVMDIVSDRILSAASAIAKFFTGDFKGAFNDAKATISGFGAEVASEFKQAANAAKMLHQVEDSLRNLNVSRAKLNRDLAKTKEIITDENASFEEKRKAIESVRVAETKQTNSELANARKKLEAIKIANGLSDTGNKEDLDKEAQAAASLYQLQEESAKNIRALNKQEKLIKAQERGKQKAIESEERDKQKAIDSEAATARKEAQSKRLENLKKSQEAGKIILDEELKNVQLTFENQRELVNKNNAISTKDKSDFLKKIDDAEAKSIEEHKKAIATLEKKYADDLKNLNAKTPQEKLDLQKSNDLLEIEQLAKTEEEKGRLIIALNAKYNLLQSELDAADKDKVDKLRNETLKSSQEKELIALQENYNAKFLLAKDDAELTQALVDESEKKQTEIKKKYAAIDKAQRLQVENSKLDAIKNTLGAISDISAAFAGKSEKQQRAAFKIQKAASIAQAIISTYQSANAAMTSPTNNLFPGQAQIMAGLSIVQGLVNVKKISSTQFQGGTPSDGGGATSVPNLSTGANAPQFNVVGNTGINQLNNLNQPIQAYVVSGEMTTQQQLDRNKLATVTL